MKITIVMGGFLPMPPSGFGAVERVWDGLAREFAHAGHKVTLICKAGPEESRQEDRQGVAYLRVNGFRRSNRLPLDLARDFAYSSRVLSRLPRADILVTNTFWLPALAWRLRPSAGRVVVHVARVPRGQYWLYDGAARFDAVSSYIRERVIASRPKLAAKVRAFPNPIDTSVLSPPERPARSGRPEATILYLGRLHPEKGVHVLIDAFKELVAQAPRTRLRLVGPWGVESGGGGEEYLKSLKRAAEGFPIEFVGPISELPRIAVALREADVFCYPSLAEHGEASPLAPLEAMATGLVPVVSDLSQFRDYLEPGRNGVIFDHRNGSAAGNLARALRETLSNPPRLEELSRRAIESARRFSYERVARLRLQDYEELLDE